MKCYQTQFVHQNNVCFMMWEILTDETDHDKVMEYIREKIYKRTPMREELCKVNGGWRYKVYEE